MAIRLIIDVPDFSNKTSKEVKLKMKKNHDYLNNDPRGKKLTPDEFAEGVRYLVALAESRGEKECRI